MQAEGSGVRTTRTGPGRPRSEHSRRAVLRATSDLLHEVGLRAMTTDGIASRSGASKATIYKWWPNKYAVAVEAFLSELHEGATEPDTGSAREDFRQVLLGLIRFYRGASGQVLAQLVGEAQFDPQAAAELRDRLLGSRRRFVLEAWDRGVARGELRPDVDRELAVELITGPALFRLFAGSGPLDDSLADEVVDAVMDGLECDKSST